MLSRHRRYDHSISSSTRFVKNLLSSLSAWVRWRRFQQGYYSALGTEKLGAVWKNFRWLREYWKISGGFRTILKEEEIIFYVKAAGMARSKVTGPREVLTQQDKPGYTGTARRARKCRHGMTRLGSAGTASKHFTFPLFSSVVSRNARIDISSIKNVQIW